MKTKLLIRQQMQIIPQLVISANLLQAAGSELEQVINREVEQNPALELVNKPKSQSVRIHDPSTSYSTSFSTNRSNHRASFEEFVENIPHRQSPLDRLIEQIAVLTGGQDREISVALLHRLDHRGYLTIPAEQLAFEIGVPYDTIERGIQVLHKLEPPGIGARDVRECFLIQCRHLEEKDIDCQKVRLILTLAWDEFLHQRWSRVARKIQAPRRQVEEAREFMRSNFHPYPLGMMETSSEAAETFHFADLIIRCTGPAEPPGFSLDIPRAEEFELKISTSFLRISGSDRQGKDEFSQSERKWIQTQIDQASRVAVALRQRWETLRCIGKYLIQYQRDFLEHGRLYLKPLTQAQVARQLNMHESTVSRAIRNKIVQLPEGRLVPLGDFFDTSLAAKEAIRIVLRDSPCRLCDREIAKVLQAQGMPLARRTVTKYRREIYIESGRQPGLNI